MGFRIPPPRPVSTDKNSIYYDPYAGSAAALDQHLRQNPPQREMDVFEKSAAALDQHLLQNPPMAGQNPSADVQPVQPTPPVKNATVPSNGEDEDIGEKEKKGVTKYGYEFLRKDASPNWKKMADTLGQLKLEGIKQQKELADKLRAELDKAEKEPDKIDFRAFGMLADAWTGSNMTQAMTDPNAAKTKRVSELTSRLQQAIGGLGDMELQALRTKLSNSYNQATLASREEQAAIGRSFQAEQAALDREARKELTQQKAGKSRYWEKRDEEAAKKSFETDEDIIKTDSSLNTLMGIYRKLEENPNLVGKKIKADAFQRFTGDEETVRVQEDAHRIYQQDMKKILDSQFSRSEADQLLGRSYNYTLSAEANKQRIKEFVDLVGKANEMRKLERNFQENEGTTKGFRDSPEYKAWSEYKKGYFEKLKNEDTDEDRRMVEWAKSNPDAPGAKEILELNGIK